MVKRIIDELELTHIAAVDNPCQEFAMARVIKRRPDEAERVPIAKVAPVPAEKAAADFETAVDAVQSRDGCNRTAAMEKVAKSHPELIEGYRAAPTPKARAYVEIDPDLTAPVRKAAQASFAELVNGLAARDRIPRHVAMERAMKVHKTAFEAAYA